MRGDLSILWITSTNSAHLAAVTLITDWTISSLLSMSYLILPPPHIELEPARARARASRVVSEDPTCTLSIYTLVSC